MVYTTKHKMAELMAAHPEVFSLTTRFGIPFGVGEQTIEEVCQEQHVDTLTFLAVVNFQLFHQPADIESIDLPTLRAYLQNSHHYYIQHRLPYLRHALIAALPSEDDHQVVMLILRFFDAFVKLVRRHIQQEEAGQVKAHAHDDQHIASKLRELTSLIVKYYPSDHSAEYAPQLVNALECLYRTEREILAHCEMEDNILLPAIEAQKEDKIAESGEALSDREKDVLVQVVSGCSNKQIADRLCLSIHTVISHRKNIVRKLDIHSTAGLTIYAVVNGLVELEQLKDKIY